MPLVKKWQLDEHVAKVPIDHPDLSVTRAKLEYPTVDVSFAYLGAINKVVCCSMYTWGVSMLARDTFADKAVFAAVQVNAYPSVQARVQDYANNYRAEYNPGAATADHFLNKLVNGTNTNLGTEAIDIDNKGRGLMIRCLGTTIQSMRFEMTSVVDPLALPTANYTISATDTSFASGYFGYRPSRETYPHGWASPDAVYLKSAGSSSPSSASASVLIPKVLGYFEVPIVGDGSLDNPFRAKMPEFIVDDPILGKRNLLALSHSLLIPTDRATGKPIHGTALVRIFAQPDRDSALKPISDCIAALKAMSGVTELTREMAIKRAKQMDDKLCDYDLLVFDKPSKAQIREYIEWRKSIFNVEMSEADAERYLKSDKGW